MQAKKLIKKKAHQFIILSQNYYLLFNNVPAFYCASKKADLIILRPSLNKIHQTAGGKSMILRVNFVKKWNTCQNLRRFSFCLFFRKIR